MVEKQKNRKLLYSLVDVYVSDLDHLNEKILLEKVDEAALALGDIYSQEDKKYIVDKIQKYYQVELDTGIMLVEKNHEKWFNYAKGNLQMKYWDRYKKYLNKNKKYNSKVINSMDDILDDLTDLLGNPRINDSAFQRRGMVIGDVQSGKTSNYIGLICKAADAGYNVVVVLTGTIESLRKQTQIRLDEGFVGSDSDSLIKNENKNKIGVGKYDNSVNPLVLTSASSDFKVVIARQVGFKIDSINQPLLFVVKKNVSVLTQLNKWLKNNNAIDDKIDKSLLIIDDEADNASVNTNKKDDDPTAINSQIRNMLETFTRSSYVGFTATPFANIFINPNEDNDIFENTLFPKNYVYALNTPTNYIGAKNIFGEDGRNSNMLRQIWDAEMYLPEKHKSTFIVKNLPKSLIKSIYTFLVSNLVRDFRGDIKEHRSMLINVSRFTAVQNQIGELINEELKAIQDAVRIFSFDKEEIVLENKYIKKLYKVFQEEYSNTECTWNDLQQLLVKSIVPIKVAVINQQHKNPLNYESYKDGLRVIAVGGLSLSRGLTLEGLCVSYFYRNSKMYDTLMQMGRWFGYRNNYEDLCRVWMSNTTIQWYESISDALEELKDEIKKMYDSGLTPKDFGLKVRNDINILSVTAKNKMRTAKEIVRNVSLSGEIVETPNIFNNYEENSSNLHALERFCMNLEEKGYNLENDKRIIYKNIKKEFICEFLDDFNTPIINYNFNKEAIKEFIETKYQGDELDLWDIVFIKGDGLPCKINGINIKKVKRQFCLANENKIIKISGKRNRLGGTLDTKAGLTLSMIKSAEENFKKEKGKSNYSSKTYVKYINGKRNPLLMIYLIQLNETETDNYKLNNKEKQIVKKYKDIPILGLSIAMPLLSSRDSQKAKYKINLVAAKEYFYDGYEYGDDE